MHNRTPVFHPLPNFFICFNQKPGAAKVSSMFGGTRDKCAGCQKTVYPTEKVTINHYVSLLTQVKATKASIVGTQLTFLV